MFLYLEMLLNSYFLKSDSKFKIDVSFIPTISTLLTVSYQNEFFTNYKNQFNKFKLKNIFIFSKKLNYEKILSIFNYYYLPVCLV